MVSVLYRFWAANIVAFNGEVVRELATQLLALAEKQGTTTPLLMAHRTMGPSLLCTGDIREARAHLDQAIALYDPAEHRPLATRFGEDQRVAALCWRSHALWLLGYPEEALVDADHALRDAREIGHATTLMFALHFTSVIHIQSGNCAAATADADELVALADEKIALSSKHLGMMNQGCLLVLKEKAFDAIQLINAGVAAWRSTAATIWVPWHLTYLGIAYAQLRRFDDAWRCSGEAMMAVKTTGEKWCEAEVNRMAGEIALKSPEPDAPKSETYFERALAVARQQQAKSWEFAPP